MTDDTDHPLFTDGHEARRLLVSVPIAREGPLSEDERRRVIEAVETYRRTHALSHKDVARQIEGLKAPSLSEILKGTYRVGDVTLDAHLRKLNNWMEVDARRRAGQRPGKPLTTTLVVRMVKTAVNLCRQQVTMGYVTGPAGVGKTATIKEIVRSEPGTIYVLANGDIRTRTRLIGHIADLLKVGRSNRSQQWRGVSLFDRVCKVLAGSNRLLVVDDAHKLIIDDNRRPRADTLELLRELHDACSIPILFLAVFSLAEEIQATITEDGGQLASRVGVRLDVRRAQMKPGGDKEKQVFTTDQIREIVAGPGLRFSDGAIAYLVDVANANGRGAIRAIQFLIPLAERAARKRSNVPANRQVTITEQELHFVAGEQDKTLFEPIGERLTRARRAAKTA